MDEQPGPSESDGGSSGRVSRRVLLIGGGAAAVAGGGAAAIIIATGGGEEEGEGYPRTRISSTRELRSNEPLSFEYPLEGQQSVLLDLDEEVPGGVGEKDSIVAYSVLCQHMGCPVGYRAAEKDFLCGCHQSRYDPARNGVVVQGVSQRPLPRVALEIDGEDIFAVGVDGLIYGYRSNLETGESAA